MTTSALDTPMMKQYLAQGRNPNLSAWLTAVDHTTSRMGLVLCGDLHLLIHPNLLATASYEVRTR